MGARSALQQGLTVTWTTADGASRTAPLTSIIAYSKKPTTGNGKPSAIPVRG